MNSSYNTLQNNFNLLTVNVSNLQSQYNAFYSNYTGLNASYMSLNSTYNSLQFNYTILKSNYTSLNSTYDSLQADYNILNSNYTSLNSSYTSLQQNYTDLQGNYTELQNIVNFNNSTTLLTNGSLTLSFDGSQDLTHLMQYAGYLSISFTASRGTLFEFSNNNYTGIYAQYPLTGNATSGTFMMPVFPGSETITIQDVPLISDIGTSNVVLNITYVY